MPVFWFNDFCVSLRYLQNFFIKKKPKDIERIHVKCIQKPIRNFNAKKCEKYSFKYKSSHLVSFDNSEMLVFCFLVCWSFLLFQFFSMNWSFYKNNLNAKNHKKVNKEKISPQKSKAWFGFSWELLVLYRYLARLSILMVQISNGFLKKIFKQIYICRQDFLKSKNKKAYNDWHLYLFCLSGNKNLC